MITQLANHLWQCTLFACVVGLLVRMLRRNRAAVRHGLWLAASIKFLVPFSLLVGLGGQVEWRESGVVPQPRLEMVEQISQPLAVLASPSRLLEQRAPSRIQIALGSLWMCGFAANCLSWCRRWRQVRAVCRAASPLPSNLPIPVLSSSARLEPGVLGVFRPFLLLPTGLSEHLTPQQFQAIVAHELCHVTRRDNLSSAIHMVVEALFWFHPAVWWIQARLLEERERACDEAVLRMGSDPQDYAQGIVTVCKFYLKSPLVCLSGVTGSDLKRRVETIMLNRSAESMSTGRKLLLFGGGVLALTVPLIVGVMNAPSIRAQEPAKPVAQLVATSELPEFEVASIKPSLPGSNLKVDFAPGGKLFITNATLRFLIKIAYDIGDNQLEGWPRMDRIKKIRSGGDSGETSGG